jgi:hypothetical protein
MFQTIIKLLIARITCHFMVQPPLQQTSKDANWKVFSKTGKKAFPETASPAQNIQHQHK